MDQNSKLVAIFIISVCTMAAIGFICMAYEDTHKQSPVPIVKENQ